MPRSLLHALLHGLTSTLGLGVAVVTAVDSVSLETTGRYDPHLVASCFPGPTEVSRWEPYHHPSTTTQREKVQEHNLCE